jgi:hypothetical protein
MIPAAQTRSPILGLFVIFGSGLVAAAAANAQSERPIYPASAAEVSFAALDDLPDLRGIWQPFFGRVDGDEPQLKSPYKERYAAELAKVAADPAYEIPERSSNCEPHGMPYMMVMPYSLEFSVTPGKIVVIQEAQIQVRRIFTDGRPFPDDLDTTYSGYSIGAWEGDTLVVETIGTRPGQRLGIRGIVNGPNLKITERIYLDPENEDILHLDFTYEDPDVLAAPWHQNYFFRRDRTWDIIEYVCDENDRHPVNDDGQTEAVLSE